jgi:hypothetical protein
MELSAGYVEIPLCAFLVSGMVLAVRSMRRRAVDRGGSFAVAAMAVGCAAGVKLTGAPPGLFVLGAAAVRLGFTGVSPFSRRAVWACAGMVAAALPVLPWMCAAWQGTGYPLSPMPLTIAGIKLGEPDSALRWYQQRPELIPYTWESERAAIRALFAGPGSLSPSESLGSLAVLPLAMAPIGAVALLFRRRATVLVALAALLPVLAHFSSNMSVVRLAWSTSMSRFWVLSVGLAGLLSLGWCRREGPLSQVYRRLLLVYPALHTLIVLHVGWASWEIKDAALFGSVLAVLLSVLASARRFGPRLSVPVALCVAGIAASLLQLRRDQTREAAFRESWALHTSPRRWVAALAALPPNEAGWDIAITGGAEQPAHGWYYYGFYGPRLEHRVRYVPTTRRGTVAHFGPFAEPAEQDPAVWADRLVAQGIDFVMSFPPASPELLWMAVLPERFRAVTLDGDMALYQVLPPRTPEPPR